VRGVVYDSLLGAPLGGALVTRRGSPGVALTDSAGRFALDGVPGAAGAFVFSHPALDSLGLADLVVPADLSVSSAAPDPVAVALATPSRATTWARLCPGVAPPADLTAVGILAGVVRDAATAAPVAGGVATVVWTAVDTVKRRVVAAPRRFAVPTDEAGAFRVCGVPVGAEFEAQGATDRSATGWAVATMGPRGLASVELLVPPLQVPPPRADAEPTAAATAAAAALVEPVAASRPPSVVTVVATGLVRDSLGVPRAGARVTVEGVAGLEATTEGDGRFRLAGVPAGTQTLVVRALGYAPQPVTVGLRVRDPEPVEVTLRRVVRLAPVSVRAAGTRGNAALMAGIARRRRVGMGSLLDSSVIARSARLETAFQQVPFTVLRPAEPGTWRLQRPDGCPLLAAVDGRLTDWVEVADLPPDYVLAIETYRRVSQVPGEFLPLLSMAAARRMPGANCGIVLVWTRSGR
jgi:hypothetical protein